MMSSPQLACPVGDLLIYFKHFKIGTMANNNDIKQLKTDIVLIIHTRQYPIANQAKMLGITNPLSSVNPVAFSLSISLHSRLLDFKCSIHVAIICYCQFVGPQQSCSENLKSPKPFLQLERRIRPAKSCFKHVIESLIH